MDALGASVQAGHRNHANTHAQVQALAVENSKTDLALQEAQRRNASTANMTEQVRRATQENSELSKRNAQFLASLPHQRDIGTIAKEAAKAVARDERLQTQTDARSLRNDISGSLSQVRQDIGGTKDELKGLKRSLQEMSERVEDQEDTAETLHELKARVDHVETALAKAKSLAEQDYESQKRMQKELSGLKGRLEDAQQAIVTLQTQTKDTGASGGAAKRAAPPPPRNDRNDTKLDALKAMHLANSIKIRENNKVQERKAAIAKTDMEDFVKKAVNKGVANAVGAIMKNIARQAGQLEAVKTSAETTKAEVFKDQLGLTTDIAALQDQVAQLSKAVGKTVALDLEQPLEPQQEESTPLKRRKKDPASVVKAPPSRGTRSSRRNIMNTKGGTVSTIELSKDKLMKVQSSMSLAKGSRAYEAAQVQALDQQELLSNTADRISKTIAYKANANNFNSFKPKFRAQFGPCQLVGMNLVEFQTAKERHIQGEYYMPGWPVPRNPASEDVRRAVMDRFEKANFLQHEDRMEPIVVGDFEWRCQYGVKNQRTPARITTDTMDRGALVHACACILCGEPEHPGVIYFIAHTQVYNDAKQAIDIDEQNAELAWPSTQPPVESDTEGKADLVEGLSETAIDMEVEGGGHEADSPLLLSQGDEVEPQGGAADVTTDDE